MVMDSKYVPRNDSHYGSKRQQNHRERALKRPNLAGNPDYAGKLAELRQELLRLPDEWDDVKNPMGETFRGRYFAKGRMFSV